ncbi:MAG: DUF1016 N-terminal domain-containing protein [Planctomycetota bacterium]|nr:DUF1016 N-terminal domain-containing protein [Planctomycetota bacterium]MDA1142332.1 DUF1016 N-terminal domain-containing protein [Planctomycetota bacterium]
MSLDLQAEFPGVRGFSAQNLWYMRQLYLACHGHEELQPLVGEISWAKHRCRESSALWCCILVLNSAASSLARPGMSIHQRRFGNLG